MNTLLKNVGLIILVAGIAIIGVEQFKNLGNNMLLIIGSITAFVGAVAYVVLNKIID